MRCSSRKISALYLPYCQMVAERKGAKEKEEVYYDKETPKKSVEGEVMDLLGVKDMCCRMHLLTHVDYDDFTIGPQPTK
jgi:DNA-directed RNA polymerase subunit N (RpoN/RPB10)